ncbi:MAG TPA: glycosyltransferase family 4 protein [Gemmatimonadales bacterium]|jgi:glycogen(starch) synthase|nr:glycosyltransferase family 4 protein [Gemmatimonadales bacterium]
MKINRAVLAGFYPPPFAGEPVHVKQLAQLLRDHGLAVEILNVNRHARPSPEYHNAPRRGALLWKLFTLADRASILHLHTHGHSRKSWLMILVASLAARLRGTSAVLTLHSGLLPGYLAGFGMARRGFARWILEPFARIVCVNSEISRAVQRLGIAGGHTTIIPAFLGVAGTAELAPPDRLLIQELRPLLVAVAGGEQEPERGLAVVLRALQQLVALLPGAGVVLMGWQVGPRTRPLIDELGLARGAVCLGEVSHDRCLAFLRAADVVVRSTFVDGDAITVREALAFGVPVVASDTAFRPEGVTLFRKGDVSDLVAKLRQVLAAPREGSSPCTASQDQPARSLWQLYSELASPGADDAQVLPPRRPAASS